MKKLLLALLLSIMLFSLCSCMKSEEAQQVDDMILNIGEITVDSRKDIDKIDAAIEKLEEKDRKSLDELDTLADIKEKFISLKVKQIEKAIDSIGKVTTKSSSKINAARRLCDFAWPDILEKVSNYSTLEKAESTLSKLRVKRVEGLIDAIGTVTLDSKAAISKARYALSALPANERSSVSNRKALSDAVDEYNALEEAIEKQAAEEAVSSLVSEHDDVQDITWYKSPNQPYYANSRSYVLPYIGSSGTYSWLRLRFHYTGDNWIFFENLIIKIDGDRYDKTYDYIDVHRDNGSGSVWEYVDTNPSSDDIAMLKKIADSDETIIRFQGSDRYYDLIVSESDKNAITEVLNAYQYLK